MIQKKNFFGKTQQKCSILCPETLSRKLPMPRNLPKSTLNLPNRHKNSNWPKKAEKIKTAKGVEKMPKITNLPSNKPN